MTLIVASQIWRPMSDFPQTITINSNSYTMNESDLPRSKYGRNKPDVSSTAIEKTWKSIMSRKDFQTYMQTKHNNHLEFINTFDTLIEQNKYNYAWEMEKRQYHY